jgi:hypothetical protein
MKFPQRRIITEKIHDSKYGLYESWAFLNTANTRISGNVITNII